MARTANAEPTASAKTADVNAFPARNAPMAASVKLVANVPTVDVAKNEQ